VDDDENYEEEFIKKKIKEMKENDNYDNENFEENY
jgi:hypothetical protein